MAVEPRSHPLLRHLASGEGNGFLAPDSPRLIQLALVTSPEEMEGKNVNNSEQRIFTVQNDSEVIPTIQ